MKMKNKLYVVYNLPYRFQFIQMISQLSPNEWEIYRELYWDIRFLIFREISLYFLRRKLQVFIRVGSVAFWSTPIFSQGATDLQLTWLYDMKDWSLIFFNTSILFCCLSLISLRVLVIILSHTKIQFLLVFMSKFRKKKSAQSLNADFFSFYFYNIL